MRLKLSSSEDLRPKPFLVVDMNTDRIVDRCATKEEAEELIQHMEANNGPVELYEILEIKM